MGYSSKSKAILVINTLSIAVIILFLNLIAADRSDKLDLTKNKGYTLSAGSKKIMDKLSDNLVVKVIISKNIPSPHNDRVRYFINLLKEYKNYSSHKLQIDIISSDSSSDLESTSSLYGIPPLQVNAIENDSLQIKTIYMGTVFLYQDKKESIPVIANIGNMEYEISSIIKLMAEGDKKKIAFVKSNYEGAGQPGQPDQFSTFKKLLGKNYTVEDVKIEKGKLLDKSYEAAILVSPIKKLELYERYALEEFLMSSKGLILALDSIQGNPQNGVAFPVQTGMEDFLEKNSITISKDLIYDMNSSIISVPGNAGGFMFSTSLRYPFFPQIINFNHDHPITQNLDVMNVIYVSPINVKTADNKTDDKINYTSLVWSSDRTGLQSSPYDVSIERKYTEKDFNNPRQTIALLVEGVFTTSLQEALEGYEDSFKKGGEGKLVLIADGDFVKDNYISSGDNAGLIMNVVDYLAADPELTTLRGKESSFHPIVTNDRRLENFLKYSSMVIPLALILICGLFIRWYISNRRINL